MSMLMRILRVLGSSAPAAPDVPLVQRRRGVRFSCNVMVACETDGGRQPARVVCIGEYGARVVVRQQLQLDRTVRLTYEGSLKSVAVARIVTARVRWVRSAGRETQAGLEFVDSDVEVASSWVYVLLRRLTRSSHLEDDRKAIRYAADFAGGVAVAPRLVQGFQPGRIINLSAGGALFEGDVDVPVGRLVELQLRPPNRPPRVLSGRVVRKPASAVGVKRLGIRFDTLTNEQAEWLRGVVDHLALVSVLTYATPPDSGEMKKS